MAPDPYNVLGTPRDADEATIRAAYRRQALECHPDKIQDPEERAAGAERFKELNNAYEVLNNAAKRAEFDRKHPPKRDVPRQPRSQPSDESSDFFEFGNLRPSNQPSATSTLPGHGPAAVHTPSHDPFNPTVQDTAYRAQQKGMECIRVSAQLVESATTHARMAGEFKPPNFKSHPSNYTQSLSGYCPLEMHQLSKITAQQWDSAIGKGRIAIASLDIALQKQKEAVEVLGQAVRGFRWCEDQLWRDERQLMAEESVCTKELLDAKQKIAQFERWDAQWTATLGRWQELSVAWWLESLKHGGSSADADLLDML